MPPRFVTVDAAADTTETIVGTDAERFVTPVGVKAALSMIDVRAYGAVGDGVTDDSAAIQAAITAAAGLRPVYLPPGTYLLNGARQGTYNALLTYVSGTEIYGDGDSSVLKIADGYTTAGDYRLFAPATAVTTDDVKFTRFKVDGNAANNLVLGSSGGDIRQAYMIFCYASNNFAVDDVTFVDCPGRNVIVAGNNLTASIAKGRVSGCRFRNVGGAITGNHLQNDHSTLYTQFADGLVIGNTFANDSVVDPASPAARVVTALEIHGSKTLVTGNTVTNFTHGGNAVAAVFDSIGNSWADNQFDGLTKLGINIWTLGGFTHADLMISGNVFRLHADLGTALAGVHQSAASGSTTGVVQNLTVSENTIEADYTTAVSAAWHGIYLTAVNVGKVVRNTTRNTQGGGIQLEGHTALPLNVSNVDIEGNKIYNAGFHTLGNRIWGLLVINAGTAGSEFHDIKIAGNTITKATAAGQMRGLSIQGAGVITDVTVDGLDRISNIASVANIATNTGSNTARVSILPKRTTIATASSPTSGVWMIGDQCLHSNVAASGTLGKVCTTAGGAAQSTAWAISTAYTVGQWVRTSTNKVLECIVAGTSDAATEPNPSTLGAATVDGTVTWSYRAANLAVFKTFGAVSA